MDRGRAAAALLALAACIACSTAAPTSSDQTALEISEGSSSGCYYNFQHYGEGDRIMTNEPCLNCTCHNRMLMCYLRVCPFTKPIGQDCTIEKRADQCCPIVTCPDVPVDLLTSTSTSSPAEYGATGLGRLDKYGCSINGKYFPEGSKVPPSPNKPCEHCYCIRNMTTCVMQECTLHVDGCTPIYHKDVCCPVRYSCDHPEDEIPLLDDMTTTIRPTPGFLLTTTTMMPVTQPSQNCVHDDQIVPDGALIKTEKACEHCYCMKGDIVCVVQECGTPMENEGKNCTSLPPRQGQCCPDTYICEGDEASTEQTTEIQELTTTPPRRFSVEGSGYRLEPNEAYTEMPSFVTEEEGSGEEHLSTLPVTEKSYEKPKPTKETLTTHNIIYETSTDNQQVTNIADFEEHKDQITTELMSDKEQVTTYPKEYATNMKEDDHLTTDAIVTISEEKLTTEMPTLEDVVTTKVEKTTRAEDILDEATLKEDNLVPEKEHKVPLENDYVSTTPAIAQDTKTTESQESTISSEEKLHTEEVVTPEIQTQTLIDDIGTDTYTTTPKEIFDVQDTTTSVNPIENEIQESYSPIYSPGRIPGEGDCLLNSITYQNNSVVPSTNNCHSSCRCISSIIKCEPIVCSLPPDYMSDCQPIYDSPESCCPTYVCSKKETTPPESHNQMSESESAKPVLASECSSPDCESLENKFSPSDCSNNECVPKDKVPSPDVAVPCDGEKCVSDTSLETHPDLHHDEPIECSSENGCSKPVDTQTEKDCSGEKCQIEPIAECIGSDCAQEITKITIPEVPITTSHDYPANELTEKPDITDKIETPHDSEKEINTSTQGLNTETQPIEEYITVPIKSSTETTPTDSSQPQDMSIGLEVTEIPEHHTTLVNNAYTSAVSETESDINKQQQSTSGPVTTESDDTFKNIDHGTSIHTTTRTNEQDVTEYQTVTVGSYETKPAEPVTEEITTYSPEPNKEIIIPTDDQVNEINVDVTTLHTDNIPNTTENVLSETITGQEPISSEVVQEDTSMPVTSTAPDKTQKTESSTQSYATAVTSEHELITELDEHYTETPSSLEFEEKGKTTESVSVVTEVNIKTTETGVSESEEYKPVYDNAENEKTEKIHTELPVTETTKSTEIKLETTETPEVTEKSDEDRATEKVEEQVSLDVHNEVTTESTTDDKYNYDKPSTEAQIDSVTSADSGDKASENTITEASLTERIIESDITVTESTKQESYTTVSEIKTTEIKHSTESGYHYQTASPVFDEKVETTVLPSEEVPIKITTESELDVATSGTISPEMTEGEVLDSKDFTTTRPQEDISNTEDREHEYHTTDESYQTSSQPSVDKDLSEKPDITTVSPMQEIATTQIQEELLNTENDVVETSKNDDQQVSVEVSTASYHEVTTNIVSLTDTMLPTVSSEPVYSSVNTQPETDTKLQTTEANIKYEDIQTTESEIKVNADITLGTSTESHIYDDESHTEMIESDIPTKAVTYIEEASTRAPSEEITESLPKEVEVGYEKTTAISEPITTVPEKTESSTRIIEIDSETKSPETLTTTILHVGPEVSTNIPDTSEHAIKELETETPHISTTPQDVDLNVEITTTKLKDTEIEQHHETGSGEEDVVTISPTPSIGEEISTSEIMTSSSATERPIEETSNTKEQIETTLATFERATESNVDIQKETSPSIGLGVETSTETSDESTKTMPSLEENILQTTEPEGLKPEPNTEETIKDSTEPLPEHDDQKTESPLEAFTSSSIHEEITTPDSSLSLVTDEIKKKEVKPHADTVQDTLTTEPLPIDQGLPSTETPASGEPEILTTVQKEPSEHDRQTTSTDEKTYNTDSSKYPQVTTEYPEKTTVAELTNKDGETPYQHVTEVSQTILPETTSESQSVTKESTPDQNLYEVTTQKIIEKETEKEAGLREITKSPVYYTEEYDTKTTVLLDMEQTTSKDTLSDIGEYGTTMAEEVDSEKEDFVTKSPSIFTTKQQTDLPEQTDKMQDIPHSDVSQDVTSISPNTLSDKDIEIQSPTEQSIPSTDYHDTATIVPIEKVTEKETEIEESTNSQVSSVSIDEQTEKEILREPNKELLETTTLVTIEDNSVTKESTDRISYEVTTMKLLNEGTEYPTITQRTTQEENLYQSTTLRFTEKETESDIQLTDTALDSSLTTLSVSSSTPTSKLPEPTDDGQKSTETAMDYSETTPYLIELQEHTHQSIDELSSKMPVEGESTTEQFISEHPDRGDIPHKDDVNVEDITTLKESTTPKSIPSTTAQSLSETPKEEDRYTVLPIETEKPLTPEEAHTEKYIPSDYEGHKPDIPADIIPSTEEVAKVTMPPVFTKPSEESSIHTEESDKPEEKPIESTEVSKPDLNEPSDDLPSPDFPPSGAGGYGQEPDYGDNEDQAFGPGTCRYGGKVYVSAQQIPRDDPCDFCFCFRSDIICLQQSCPPPIHGCHEEPIQGFCCPRYECPVSMATTLNVTTTTTTTTTTLPPHFLPHAYKGAAQRRGCQIKGHTYKVGEVVRASSGPCLHCTCGGDGQMKCDPKACTPEPMLRQMIAAAVSAKRRR